MTKLLIGLGNPGPEYAQTRHNVGFIILDALAKKHDLSFERQKWQGLFTEYWEDGEKVLLLKPQTFMNLSGQCVQPWAHFLKISLDEILVIHDELDLALGRIKLQRNASPAGHRGVASIIQHLGSQDFPRLRAGIGHPGSRQQVHDHVLSSFRSEESELKQELVEHAVRAAEQFVKLGLDLAVQMLNKQA